MHIVDIIPPDEEVAECDRAAREKSLAKGRIRSQRFRSEQRKANEEAENGMFALRPLIAPNKGSRIILAR